MAFSSRGWRWLSLVGVIWLQSINGTNSNYPAYSSQLKKQLSLSQLQLNNLALASDAGKLFGWCAGLAAIYLPLWLVLVIGSSLSFIGYGVQYLFLTHHISSPLSYWHLFFLTVVAGNGICWINTVCYLVTIHNFPDHHHTAVGLTTSYLGLSAVIYTALVNALFSGPSSAQSYMLLNAIVPLAISIGTAPFVRYFGKPAVNKKKAELGFVVLLLITIATGIYAVASSFQPMGIRRQPSASPWFKVFGMGACLVTPLVIPLAESVGDMLLNRDNRVCDDLEIVPTTTTTHHHHHHRDVGGGEVPGNQIQTKDEDSEKEMKAHEDEDDGAIENIGATLMLTRLNFWLYFLIYLCGATLGLVYLNNLGQIAESRGYSVSRTSSLVSLASAFMFFGRLLSSILDYVYSSRRRGTSRGPATIVAVMVPMAAAFFLIVKGSSSLCLQLSTSIIGLGTGVITAITVSTTSELFGAKNFGVNHNVVVANIPFGSFLFGDMAALIYRNQGQGHTDICLGLHCYHITFLTWGCLCSFGAVLALVLHFRTRPSRFFGNCSY